jgi:hypothetical protein
MKIGQPAGRLELAPRQIKGLVRAYRQAGPKGLVSRRRGKPSNHRLDDAYLVLSFERQRYVVQTGVGRAMRCANRR